MNVIETIRLGIDCGEMVSLGYLNDLTDAEMMLRPAPGCNHINWQVGHLIASEFEMMGLIAPDAMPELPDGFAARYSKQTAGSDLPGDFCTKEELMQTFRQQRAGTLAILEKQTPESLDRPTGVNYAPTVGSMLSLQGSHWLMHCGQWAVVRRQTGRPPLF